MVHMLIDASEQAESVYSASRRATYTEELGGDKGTKRIRELCMAGLQVGYPLLLL